MNIYIYMYIESIVYIYISYSKPLHCDILYENKPL